MVPPGRRSAAGAVGSVGLTGSGCAAGLVVYGPAGVVGLLWVPSGRSGRGTRRRMRAASAVPPGSRGLRVLSGQSR